MNFNALANTSVLVALAAFCGTAMAAKPEYAEIVCTPNLQDVGRMEADAASKVRRWEDGRLRTVDQEGEYYATEPKDMPLAEWILVYGAQSQRGNSEIGFVRSDNLECGPLL